MRIGCGGTDNIAEAAGYDQISGGASNGVIDGEAGVDTAIFTGNRVAYTIAQVVAQNRFDMLQGARERELANLHRSSGAARQLSDEEFAAVLGFTQAAFDMEVVFRYKSASK